MWPCLISPKTKRDLPTTSRIDTGPPKELPSQQSSWLSPAVNNDAFQKQIFLLLFISYLYCYYPWYTYCSPLVKFLQFVGIVSTSPSPNIEYVCCPCLCIGFDLFADLCQKMRIGKAGDEPPQWPLGGQRSWVSANPSPSKTKTTPIKYGSNDVEIPY